MDFKTHCHTPYIVILIKMLSKWRATYKTEFPSTDKDQSEFEGWIKAEELVGLERKKKEKEEREKNQVKEDIFSSALFEQTEEENFKDALSKSFQAWVPVEIHDDVLAVMNDSRAESLTKESTDFWFLVSGLKRYVANEGKGYLPLPGSLPDMTSDSETYMKLQGIYRRKARDDMNMVKKYVDDALVKAGRKAGDISEILLRDFCKNIHYIRVFHFKSIEDEFNPKKIDLDIVRDSLSDSDNNLIYYFMLRACDEFASKYGFYPGANPKEDTSSSDAKTLKEIVSQILSTHDVTDIGPNLDDVCAEMVRFGASEIHNISSLLGGVSAQELIKLCTAQRLPFVNTWIYNGMNATSQVFKL
jgi:amyloid beta precursor protein binding protein 1